MSFRATLRLLCLGGTLQTATAAQNSTIVSGWIDDPDGRGTFTIVSSCVLTLSLCVYTAIHLNVRLISRQNCIHGLIQRYGWFLAFWLQNSWYSLLGGSMFRRLR